MRISSFILIGALYIAALSPLLGGCSPKAMDREAASDIVLGLPEVKTYTQGLLSARPPATPFARTEAGPKDMDGDYFMVTIGEEGADRTATWHRFFVNAADGRVLVEDTGGRDRIPLDEWRSKRAD